MKHVLVVALVLSVLGSSAQVPVLPPAPADSIDLRLDMASEHMRKAAWHRTTSVVIAVVGGFFTTLVSDRSYPGYRQREAVITGGLTAVGFGFTQWMGAHHDRKASRRLSGHFE